MYDLDIKYFADGMEYMGFSNLASLDTKRDANVMATVLTSLECDEPVYNGMMRKRNADRVSFDVRKSGSNSNTNSRENGSKTYDLDITYFADTEDGMEYLEFWNLAWLDTERDACMMAEALARLACEEHVFDGKMRERNADGASFDVRPSGPNPYTHSLEARLDGSMTEWHMDGQNG